jgi:hypothetical protein
MSWISLCWLRLLGRPSARACRAAASHGRRTSGPRFRLPRVEPLEDRTVPSSFTVTNLFDSGPGSLRQAIRAANANPGPDVIDFAPGLQGTIVLTSGELSVTDAVTINGPGAGRLAVSGNDASRLFHVAGSAGAVTLAHLTVTRGRASDGPFGIPQGGGILNEAGATLNLTQVVLSDNQAGTAGRGGFGGGIWNQAGATLTVSRSVVSDNRTATDAGGGGGLFNEGTAAITASTFTGNRAAFAGGILHRGTILTVTDSTFTKNQATATFSVGGAIDSEFGTVIAINNSVFTGNQATGDLSLGGALSFFFATATLTNSTLLGNRAGGRDRALGGGIVNLYGTLSVANSTLLGNQAVAGPGLAGGTASGGGIETEGGALTVSDSAFLGNSAVGGAGGTGAPGGPARGGGVNSTFDSAATFTGTLFLGNQAQGGAGGAGANGGDGVGGGIASGSADFPDGSALSLDNSLLRNNLAQGGTGCDGGNGRGGGLFAGAGTTATVRHSAVSENQAAGGAADAGGAAGRGEGGGLWIDALAQVCLDLLAQTRLRHNHASTSGDDVFGGFSPC